jgi:hypothetical protein
MIEIHHFYNKCTTALSHGVGSRKTEAHKINTNILFTILLNTAPTNLKDKLKKKKGYSSITNKKVPPIAKTSMKEI